MKFIHSVEWLRCSNNLQEEFKIYFKTYAIAAILETCHNLCLHIAPSINIKSVYRPDLSLPTSLAIEVIKLLRYKGLLSKRIREKILRTKNRNLRDRRLHLIFFKKIKGYRKVRNWERRNCWHQIYGYIEQISTVK